VFKIIVFRRSAENQYTINFIDELGNHSSTVQAGWMNITSHESILAALKNRASCFSNRGSIRGVDNNLVSWAFDKTGIADASFLCNNNENTKRIALAEQHKKKRVTDLGIPEEALQIHGVAPMSKAEGVIRLIYENMNSINNKLSKNDKVEKAKEIIDELEVDIVM
jgi:hypothetical protein